MCEILNVTGNVENDDSITGIQYHSYNPYTTTYDYNDQIRIVIQQQDIYLLPHDCYLYIECKIKKRLVAADAVQPALAKFVNNAAAFLFDEMRYELNGYELDRCKNVGITTSMKGYVSFLPDDINHLEIAGWCVDEYKDNYEAKITYCLPLKYIFGFIEDHRSIIINSKHELIMVRSRSDLNALIGVSNNVNIEIEKIQWRIPHVQVSDHGRLKLMKHVEKKQPIPLNFRSWELFEHTSLPQTDRHVWSVKASSQINTPRYVIIGFQSARNNLIGRDKSRFDHCDLSDLKVFLNSEFYPHENMNIDFENDQYALLYDMYARFQRSYYHDRTRFVPFIKYNHFKIISPFVVIDCSRQNESIKKSIIDIRIEMQTKNNIPEQTTAYCLIIHHNMFTYNPYTNIVNKMI